jgi:hypothetical protein
MNDSVESDAFVIPSSNGRPDAGFPPFFFTRLAAYGHRDGNFVLVTSGHKRRFEFWVLSFGSDRLRGPA